MSRAKNGEAIRPIRRTPKAQRNLTKRLERAQKEGDLATWKRIRSVLGYIRDKTAQQLADELDVDRSTVNRWLRRYDRDNMAGLETGSAPGAAPRLSLAQREELGALIDAGPQAAGFDSGMWTGPMIGEVIKGRWTVEYHQHHISKLLHQMGFSVQRPRKRLARADKEAQAHWIRERFPEIKKRPLPAGERSCSATKSASGLDGTLHQTWSRVGVQPRADTYGQRKTAHIFGTVGLYDADFQYQFADVFNGHTFHVFLLMLVAVYGPRKIFLIVDNGSCHNLDEEGKAWLRANPDKIELFRLPAYSPEFNPIEGVWKLTRKRTTHNRFYATVDERDSALRKTFSIFKTHPDLVLPQVARFQ